MAKSPTRIEIYKAATKYMDEDFDGFVIQLGEEIGVCGKPNTLMTLNAGNFRAKVVIRDDELDALIEGLKRARKARRNK